MSDDIKYQYPLSYDGNLLWPILFLIFFFPVGFLLLFFNGRYLKDGIKWGLNYRGSQGWLIFWTIIFFPIAIILGALNGFDVVGKSD